MLLINGSIKDRAFEDETISPKELIKLLGLPEPKGTVEFRVLGTRAKRDRFGQKRQPAGLQFTSEYTVSSNFGEFSLRYYTSKTGRNEKTKFNPSRLGDIAGGAAVLKANELDKFVWYWLHPANADSPFKGRRPSYFVYDAQKEHEAILANEALAMAVRGEIMTMPFEPMAIRAKGLTISNGRERLQISEDVVKNEISLRSTLITWLNQYPKAFVEAWKTSGASLVGTVRHAIDKGLLLSYKDSSAGGLMAWRWNGVHGNERLCIVNGGENPQIKINTFFANNFDTHWPLLEEAIGLAGSEARLNEAKGAILREASGAKNFAKVASQLDNSELIRELLGQGIIEYDRTQQAVLFLSKATGEQVIVPDVDRANWRQAMSDLLDADKNLRNKLVISLTGNAKGEFAEGLTDEDIDDDSEDALNEAPPAKRMGRPKTKK